MERRKGGCLGIGRRATAGSELGAAASGRGATESGDPPIGPFGRRVQLSDGSGGRTGVYTSSATCGPWPALFSLPTAHIDAVYVYI